MRPIAVAKKKSEKVVVSDDALKDPHQKLEEYIERERAAGTPRPMIVQKLRDAGWPLSSIERIVDKFSDDHLKEKNVHKPHSDHETLIAFLKEKLDLGYDVHMVERSLTRLGWDPKLIGKLLTELKEEAGHGYSEGTLKRLRSYIQHKREEGIKEEEIRDQLVSAGWRRKEVEAELWGVADTPVDEIVEEEAVPVPPPNE